MYLYSWFPPTRVGGILNLQIAYHALRTHGTQDGYQTDQLDVLNGQTGPDISGVIQDELMDMYMSCVNPPGGGGIPPGG